jgi:precorrin-8X/cobalt-precorrin-8 methylmutase
MFDYLRDPQAIYAKSFALVREATDLSAVPQALQPLVIRLVHACGLPQIVPNLAWSDDIQDSAWSALSAGSAIYCDSEMVVNGIIRSRLPASNAVRCTLNNDDVPAIAAQLATTRSAAALEHWIDAANGAVVVIGNAPTALFRLLELIAADRVRPAAILGFPVGFVGAAESKQSLVECACGVPFMTLHGRLGGSAIASASINGLASCQ